MSFSELFTLRNKIQKGCFEEFQKLVFDEQKELDRYQITNLFLYVYGSKDSR